MTDWMPSNIIFDLIRNVFAVVDMIAYSLLKAMYQVFFNVASANIFTGTAIRKAYFRIQLIIGIVMIFKLSVTIIQSIINPDRVSQKQTGMMSIIGRVFIVLVLLTLITPLNIKNPRNTYEEEIQDKGIIFGILFSLQNRILCQNTIGKLILGSSDNSITNTTKTNKVNQSSGTCDLANSSALEDAGNRFAATILRVFVRINVVDSKNRKQVPVNKEPEDDKANWVCTDIDDKLIERFKSDTADPSEILQYVNLDCNTAMNSNWTNSVGFSLKNSHKKLFASGSYAFWYLPLVGSIVAFALTIVLLGFSIDIAIRAAKLAILRMIAPIPVISYITPSKDNGTFGTWVKNVTTTYLDLFIRLAIVYFVINLINQIMNWRVSFGHLHGFVGGISFIMIVIGLFIFAREAPKFIKDALGIKGAGSNIGLSALMAGASTLRAGGSLFDAGDAMRQTTDANVAAYNQGKAPPSINAGRDVAARIVTGNDKMDWGTMRRGQRKLAQEGITPRGAGRVSDASKEAAAFTQRMESDAARFSQVAASGGTPTYQYMDDQGNAQNYKFRVARRNAAGNIVTDPRGNIIYDTRNVTNEQEMSLALDQQHEISGKLQSQDKKISQEIERNGQTRSYSVKKRRGDNQGHRWQPLSDAVNSNPLNKSHPGRDTATRQSGVNIDTHN